MLRSGLLLIPKSTTFLALRNFIPVVQTSCIIQNLVSPEPLRQVFLLKPRTAGQDATDAFFGLHRHEVLLRPQYARLQIGKIAGQEEQIKPPIPGELSKVPYAEPTWLSPGYSSPYYTDSHRRFQKAVREFFETVVAPESARCEASGKHISQEVVDKLAYVLQFLHLYRS